MLNVKKAFSNSTDTKSAVDSVVSGIRQSDVKFVIFFVSPKFDFTLASKMFKEAFQTAEVIGCTTAGEIGANGFSEGNIIAMSIASDDFVPATAVIKDIKMKAIFAKNDILNAFAKTGLDVNDPDVHKKGFGFVLIDGIQASEEKVLSVLSSALKDFPIVGGSAADGMDFKQTLVSANGEVYSNAAVVTFVKTNKKFFVYKENIYTPTDVELKVTKADLNTRIVYEFNNKPAAEEYARVLGVPTSELSYKHFMSNPVGRQFGDSIWITSPFQVLEGGAIQFYAQIMVNSTVKLLKPVNSVEEAKKTVQAIKTNLPNAKAVIGFSCLLRTLQFQQENSTNSIYNELSKAGEFIGFTCYGEQFGKQHVNQTLTLIALGE